ncbi:MAG: hypothetical protein ACRDTT_27680, partial [Pseudonocardiaceae bacterium]
MRKAVADFVDDLRWARDEDDIARRITERPRKPRPAHRHLPCRARRALRQCTQDPRSDLGQRTRRFLSRIWWPRYPGLWARAIVESPAAFR